MNTTDYDTLVAQLGKCSTQEVFDELLRRFICDQKGLSGACEQFNGLYFLSNEPTINERVWKFCRQFFASIHSLDMGDFGFRHLVFTSFLAPIPDFARRCEESRRAWILEWFFRFLSDESVQWVIFEAYELDPQEMFSDFSFMLQARDWKASGRSWGT